MLEQSRERLQDSSTYERLIKLRASLVDRKSRVDSDLQHESGPVPADFSEQAAAAENDEALVAIQGELGLQLHQVNIALQRLESGEYGICEDCRSEIGSARLEVIPMASLCFNCSALKD